MFSPSHLTIIHVLSSCLRACCSHFFNIRLSPTYTLVSIKLECNFTLVSTSMFSFPRLYLLSTRLCSTRSAEPSLTTLSSLGHFLKGSSAALGIIRVQASCEKMQHYGNLRDEEAGESLSEDEALKRIKGLLADCKRDYEAAMVWMKKLYAEDEA